MGRPWFCFSRMSGYNNCQVISSNCPNGPSEIISNDGGYLFRSNNRQSFINTIESFLKVQKKIRFKENNTKKRIKNFTIFHHSLVLKEILN